MNSDQQNSAKQGYDYDSKDQPPMTATSGGYNQTAPGTYQNPDTAVSGYQAQFADEDDLDEHGNIILKKSSFPELDENARTYASLITTNVIEKLKYIFKLDDEETPFEQVQEFLAKKFKKPIKKEFKNNMEEKPYQEILDASIFGHAIQREEKSQEVSRKAREMREQMVGYADALIERQDRYDILKKIESFQIETASRRALKDLVGHYTQLDAENKKRIEHNTNKISALDKKFELHESLIKKLQHSVQEIPQQNKKIQAANQQRELMKTEMVKDREAIKNEVKKSQNQIEARMDHMIEIDERQNGIEATCEAVKQIALDTKKEIFELMAKEKIIQLGDKSDLQKVEQKLQNTIGDAQYWLKTYTDSFKEHDKRMVGLRLELTGRLDTALDSLNRFVTLRDVKINFKTLNDMLFVKFRQLEDTKAAVRDMLAYQKYFMPMQLQTLIGENMFNLKVAMDDQNYIKFTQTKFKDLADTIDAVKESAISHKDADIEAHLNELDHYGLRSQEWRVQPLEIAQNDFVGPLLEKYLIDLGKRQLASSELPHKDNYCTILRKELTLDCLEGQMNDQFDKNRLLRMSAKDREIELEKRKQAELHTARVHKTVNKKLGMRKKKALKRANSFLPELDEFADMEDEEGLENVKRQMNREAGMDRTGVNFQLGDCTEKRIVKDFLRSENADVEGQQEEEESEIEDIGLPRDVSTLTKQSKHSMKSTTTHWKDGQKKNYGDRNPTKRNADGTPQPEYDSEEESQSANDGIQRVKTKKVSRRNNVEEEEYSSEGGDDNVGKMLLQGVNVSQHGTVRVRKPKQGDKTYEVNPTEPQIMMMVSQEVAVTMGKQEPPPGKIVDPKQMFGGKRERSISPAKNKQKEDRGGKQNGGGTLDDRQKRKLMADIKADMKPMVQQLCDFQISKATGLLKTSIRKLEADLQITTTILKNKIEKENKLSKEFCQQKIEEINERLEQEVRSLQRKMARDRADNELKFCNTKDTMADHTTHLAKVDVHLNTLAIMSSNLIENVNMQMEAETSDLIDRRMMQLFAVAHPNPTKNDVTQGLSKLPGQNKFSEDHTFGKRLASQIAETGIPELGLEGKKVNNHLSSLPSLHKRISEATAPEVDRKKSDVQSPEEAWEDKQDHMRATQAAMSVYQENTTLNNEILRKEYSIAHQLLQKTGEYPIKIDKNCLSCMTPGQDTSVILKLFRTACLSYQPSNVAYREHTISRTSLIGMRRDLIDKINRILETSDLFAGTSVFPRRYFDDLVIEHQMAGAHLRDIESLVKTNSNFDTAKMKQFFDKPNPLPFHDISGRKPSEKPIPQQTNAAYFSTFSSLQSPRQRLEDNTTIPDTNYGRPGINDVFTAGTQGTRLEKGKVSIQDHNFGLAGNPNDNSIFNSRENLTIETNSQSHVSQARLRQQQKGASTMRHLRNNTIDMNTQSSQFDISNQPVHHTAKKKGKKFKLILHQGGQSGKELQPSASIPQGVGNDRYESTGKYTNLALRSERKQLLKGKATEGIFGSDPISININTDSSKNVGPVSRSTKKIQHGMLDIKSGIASQVPLTALNEVANTDSAQSRYERTPKNQVNSSLPQI